MEEIDKKGCFHMKGRTAIRKMTSTPSISNYNNQAQYTIHHQYLSTSQNTRPNGNLSSTQTKQ